MKRLAPILLLGLLACNSTSPDRITPTMPVVSQRATSPASLVELFSDEFCKGGNVWWSARFNIIDFGASDDAIVRVYTIDSHGQRRFFATAKTGVPELEGTDFHFYAEGIAPPDSIPDLHGADFPPNYGFAPFAFDVYKGTHREPTDMGIAYSDIPLTSNLFPHACQGIKPRTGCGHVASFGDNHVQQSQVAGVWYWQLFGEFLTGPCVETTLRLKAYFVYPSGKQTFFARGEGTVTNPFGGHEFTLAGKAPVLDVATLPSDWTPRFVIVVTSNGTPVGQFDFVSPVPLTPNP